MNPRMTFFPYKDWTCLHNAAQIGQFEVFKFISKSVTNINPKARQSTMNTPLHIAANGGYFEICKLIIDAIEDFSPKDSRNWTPYDYASRNGHLDICIYIDEVRNQRNGLNLISKDESKLKAEGGWPYKNMAKFFPAKNDGNATMDPAQDPSQSSSCVIS